MASSQSRTSSKVTKPKPRGLPVSRSCGMKTSEIGPYFSKALTDERRQQRVDESEGQRARQNPVHRVKRGIGVQAVQKAQHLGAAFSLYEGEVDAL